MESLKNTYKILFLTLLIFTLFLCISCDEELTEQDIAVRVVNETNCTLQIYMNEEHKMILAPYTGNNIADVGEGQKHLSARRDGDLELIEDTYVELHVGDEYTWVVDAFCSNP